MLYFIFKRILGLIPLFIGITLLSFFIIHLAPGRPTGITDDLNPKISLEVRERLTKLYDLDKPLIIQYKLWVLRLLKLDFGNSFSDGRPVIEKISATLPITLLINILSLFLIFLISIPLGISEGINKNSAFDKISTIASFVIFAMPTFWLALILLDIFGVKLSWFPVSGIRSLDFEYLSPVGKIMDTAKHLAMPVFVSSIASIAGFSRYIRQNMIEVIDKKYILAARSHAIPQKSIYFNHALKNALLPVITILGLSIPGLVGGSVIFESIFAIPGTGRLFFYSVMARDYPVIMALLVIGSGLTLLGNLAADIGYALADPRIKYAKEG